MKTVILGNSGSGKTSLAQRLAEVESVPVVHLDEIFWETGGFDKKRAPEEVFRMIEEVRVSSEWVVEGVFGELAEPFLEDADRLVWLDIEWSVCRARLEQRGSESKVHMDREQSETGLARLIEWASEPCMAQFQTWLPSQLCVGSGLHLWAWPVPCPRGPRQSPAPYPAGLRPDEPSQPRFCSPHRPAPWRALRQYLL